MRLVLRNYLYSLKEDKELDRICVEMLEDMGMTVHASAQKGVRQYGVDVLAHGSLPGCDENKVYALVIKCKDIERDDFYKAKTGVLDSIKEALSVFSQSHLPIECQKLPIVVCVVCGGEIKGEVRGNLSALEKELLDWYKATKGNVLEFEEWTGDKLASMLVNSLQNSNLLINGNKRLLFRALALAQEPQESYKAFREFVNQILVFSAEAKNALRLKALREVNLALAMLIHECEDNEVRNLEVAWLSSEYAYLREWEYVQRCKTADNFDKKFDSALEDVARMYCRVAEAYVDRISIFAKERYGFTLAVNGSNELDVILRFYDVLGRISSFGLYILENHGKFCSRDGNVVDAKRFGAILKKILELMMYMATGNPVAATPILDSHSFAISSCFCFLCRNGAKKFVGEWLEILVAGVAALFSQKHGYPVSGLAYKELLEHLYAPLADKKVEELFNASELIPVLAVSAIKLGRIDVYNRIRELAMSLPRKVNYQIWFLDDDSEKEFYCGNQLCGSQLCSLNIENRDGLIDILEKEVSASPIKLSCAETAHAGLLYIGCRHYGFPLPGNIWA